MIWNWGNARLPHPGYGPAFKTGWGARLGWGGSPPPPGYGPVLTRGVASTGASGALALSLKPLSPSPKSINFRKFVTLNDWDSNNSTLNQARSQHGAKGAIAHQLKVLPPAVGRG